MAWSNKAKSTGKGTPADYIIGNDGSNPNSLHLPTLCERFLVGLLPKRQLKVRHDACYFSDLGSDGDDLSDYSPYYSSGIFLRRLATIRPREALCS
jgi:hypothetical protein